LREQRILACCAAAKSRAERTNGCRATTNRKSKSDTEKPSKNPNHAALLSRLTSQKMENPTTEKQTTTTTHSPAGAHRRIPDRPRRRRDLARAIRAERRIKDEGVHIQESGTEAQHKAAAANNVHETKRINGWNNGCAHPCPSSPLSSPCARATAPNARGPVWHNEVKSTASKRRGVSEQEKERELTRTDGTAQCKISAD
jgi:hypothetical protein